MPAPLKMPTPPFFMNKYPKLVRYVPGGSYPGCVAAMPEPGTGIIVYIPIPVTGNNGDLEMFERVTIAKSEVEDLIVGGVELRCMADPKLLLV